MNSSVLCLIKEYDSVMTDLRLCLCVSPGSIREAEPLMDIYLTRRFVTDI